MTAFVNDIQLQSLRLTVPKWGSWVADAVFMGGSEVSGSVTVKLQDMTLLGHVFRSSSYAGETRARILAGYGGWGKRVSLTAYHRAAGLKLAPILGDYAAACGERMGSVPDVSIGAHYSQHDGVASQVFQLLPSGLGWLIGDDGLTQVGALRAGSISPKFELLNYDPSGGMARVSTEEAGMFRPGLSVTLSAELGARRIDAVTWHAESSEITGELWLAN